MNLKSLLLCCALASPTTALAYTQTLSATTVSDGQAHTFSFVGLPTANGTVTLTVGLQGDFSYGDLSNPEGSENYADGNFLGTFIPANDTPPSSDCGGAIYNKDFTFPASYVNDNNAVTILVDLYPEVNAFCTGEQDISATITYSDNTPPTISPIADQAGTEDVAGSVGFTVSDAEDAAGSLILSAVSSNLSVIDLVNTSNVGGSGTASWTPVADASGTTTITVTATDSGGVTASETFDVVVAPVNDRPVAVANGPYTGIEGSPVSLDATGSSDIDNAVVGYEWDCDDDGVFEVVLSSVVGSCVFPDDGSYTVGLQVQDAAGIYSLVQTTTVNITNVAPTLTSVAPTTAIEGQVYGYSPAVSDPGTEVFSWSLAASAPASMVIVPSTGSITWTPTYADYLNGPFSVTLTVDDGDGGSDAQTFSITVLYADVDADGMADGWESANGLDPADPGDAAGDPDGDNLSNLDEFQGGTDPNSFDGPEAPVLIAPIAGAEVSSVSPDLSWTNAFDPQGDTLIYNVEVYEDAALSTLVTSSFQLNEGGGGETSWTLGVNLTENGTYWWRAQAEDSNVAGPWSAPESFFVNEVNEAPDTAVLTYPIGGEVAASFTPTLQWSEAGDIDGDAVSYEVSVLDINGVSVLTSGTGIVGDGSTASWTVDISLSEDVFYTWTVTTVDEHGLAGLPTAPEEFVVSTENAAPSDVVFIVPMDGAALAEVSPFLECSTSTDPEGGALEYWFEVDTAASFDSADYRDATKSLPGWELSVDGVVLPENVTIYARVRAIDDGGVSSSPDTISFFIRGTNDAPSTPVLLSPDDGAEGAASPDLTVQEPSDPEGDPVFLEFAVARDVEMTDVVATGVDIAATGLGSVSWTVSEALQGTVYWSARARDELGATSDWATPWRYEAPVPSSGDDDDDDDDDGTGGCDCQSSVSQSAPSMLWLGLLPLGLALRRRRA